MMIEQPGELELHNARGGRPYSLGHRLMYETPKTLIGDDLPVSILDIGVGIGYLCPWILSRSGHTDYLGIDPDTDCIDFLRAKYGTLTFVNDTWPTAGVSPADFTFCIEVLEHVQDDRRDDFVKAIRDHTLGAAFISTPNRERSKHGVMNTDEMLCLLGDHFAHAVALDWQWTCLYIATP